MSTVKFVLPVAMLCGLGFSQSAIAIVEDDPMLTKVMLDQLEYRYGEQENPLALVAQAWVGKDLDKLWLKMEGEYSDSDEKDLELQLLYSRAASPFWDMQVGWRGDLQPTPNRQWLALGFQGLAPYFIEVDGSLYLGKQGRSAARLELEYELMLTQQWVLSPELELNAYGKDDIKQGIKAGFSDMALGLRLRFEVVREFAPYVGINWERKLGNTAAIADNPSDLQWIAGIRAWF